MSVIRLGIGELKVVKQKLVRYERGEIAHIENVMRTEKRERKHRRLQRKEETYLIEEETTEVSERDLQTTERFEMQRETASIIKSDMKFDAGLKVSGSYGTVNFEATSNFATSSSSTDSSKASARYAREVTERAESKVTERVREVRTRSTLLETEEKNLHSFDNRDGDEHISGIYQWVDKVYSAQIMNYGYRLMNEFIVPEPAAFYLHAQKNRKLEGVTLKKPPDPGALDPRDLDKGTYETWVARYNVKDVSPPPPKVKFVATAIEVDPQGKPAETTEINKELKVPVGYVAKFAWAVGSRSEYKRWDDENRAPHLAVFIGRFRIIKSSAVPQGWGKIGDLMGYPDQIVPVAVHATWMGGYVFNIEVKCERLPETLEAWQLKTYAAIIAAYEKRKSAYDAQVSAAKLNEDMTLPSHSSSENRTIEKQELKRACITLLSKQNFSQFDAMKLPSGSGYPEIDLQEAAAEGPYIQFLEQAFEWDQMTYLFYPYFWARKSKWVDLMQLEDSDTVFAQFLRAGSARVVVPVRPGYEEAVAYFQQTGKPWMGGTPPVINDPLFVSVVSELKAKSQPYAGAVPEGEPWEIRLPTTLVTLPDATLPTYV